MGFMPHLFGRDGIVLFRWFQWSRVSMLFTRQLKTPCLKLEERGIEVRCIHDELKNVRPGQVKVRGGFKK